jgi:hypothetical protein
MILIILIIKKELEIQPSFAKIKESKIKLISKMKLLILLIKTNFNHKKYNPS